MMMRSALYQTNTLDINLQCQLTETTVRGQTCRSIRTHYSEPSSLCSFSLLLQMYPSVLSYITYHNIVVALVCTIIYRNILYTIYCMLSYIRVLYNVAVIIYYNLHQNTSLIKKSSEFECNRLCNSQFHWSVAFTGHNKLYVVPYWKLCQNIDLK